MLGQAAVGQGRTPLVPLNKKSSNAVAGVEMRDKSPETPAVPDTYKGPSGRSGPTGPSDGETPSPGGKIKRMALIAGLTVGASILSIVGFNCWHYLTTHESTDDAYTTGHMHPISARINDTVQRVLVDDNDHVKAGQVLVVLDGRDYKVRVQQALAALNVAKHQAEAARTSISLAASTATGKTTEAAGTVANATASISRALAALAEAKSGVPAAQAALAQRKSEEWRANVDYRRFEQLAQQGAVSFQQRDAALRDVQVAEQARKAAEEAIRQAVARAQQADHAVTEARAMLLQSKGTVEEAKAYAAQTQVSASQYDVAESSITQAQAQLDDAQLQLSYTNITAPVDGRVGKKSVEEGQRVQPGQQLMSVVSDDVWVTANFKETQLEQMRPGQKVSIKMDSFPHKEFTGTVQSFAPGSGASFALLPPDNATGNFTKIVQRIPVKVVFDRESVKGYEELIVPGMSATVSVSVSH